MELQAEKLQHEAVERYKKEQFTKWKDVALVACALASLLLNAAITVFGFFK